MSDNADLFRDTAERILADTLTHADVEAVETRQIPSTLYDALYENGITTMLVPEAKGGIGASLPEALTIVRAAGVAAAPGPLLETMLGQSLLAKAGLEPTGGLIALAFADEPEKAPAPGAAQWDAPPVFHDVPWGGIAAHFLIVLKAGAETRLILSKTADWSITEGRDAAGEPRDRLSGEKVPIMMVEAASSYEDILRSAAILRGGQILGAIEWMFRRSVEYAGERKQFGREIGKFQVVQQMLAELADHSLASAGITEAAVEACSPTLVAAARSRLADAADAAIEIAHQVHGAIGFSREYALNHRTRRLVAWRDDYGTVLHWRRRLASDFIGLSREAFWPAVADAGLRKVEPLPSPAHQ